MNIKFTKILVGLDESSASKVALEKGMAIAQKYGGEVHVVYVDSPNHKVDWSSVEEYVKKLKEKTGVTLHEHHKKGRAYREIVHTEKEISADLIVTGTHGINGFMPFWIGSTAFRVVSASKCPVITVQENAENLNFKNIVVPIVDTPESRQKLGHAASLARAFGSTVHILCADKAKDAETTGHLLVFQDQAAAFFEENNVQYTSEIKQGVSIVDAILDFAKQKQAGMILMMTERESSSMFMGTTAQQLINHSPIPVFSIHNKHIEGVSGAGL